MLEPIRDQAAGLLAWRLQPPTRVLAVNRWPDGSLSAASNGGVPAGPGTLDEYAALGTGLLALYRATSEPAWRREALRLVDEVLGAFAADDGGFFLTRQGVPAPLGRRFEVFDQATPSGNGLMAGLLVDLGADGGRPDLAAAAARYLHAQAPLLRVAGLEMGTSLEALLRLDSPRCGPDGCTL